MNQLFEIKLGVILLVAAVTLGVLSPWHARATEAETSEATTRDRVTAAKPAFGPVIERRLVHPADSTTDCVLDLESGEFIAAPPEVGNLLRDRFDEETKSTRPVGPIIDWARSSGADLTLSMTAPDVALFLYDGLIAPAGSFTKMRADEVLSMATEALRQRKADDKPKLPMWLFQRPKPPHDEDAFVIQTREGGIGLLQIVGSTEEPRSVTVRYKLLTSKATQPEREPSLQLQVIHLQHIESRALLEMLEQLQMIDQNLLAATPKTNRLVLRGATSSLMEAIALIELLDSPHQSRNPGKSQVKESEAVVPVRQADEDSSTERVHEDRRTADELQRFQGTWPMDICDSEVATLHAPQKEVKTWKWAIDGDQIAWSRSAGEVWKMTFSIDPTKSPPHIDLTYLDGPFKGVVCQGIYQWGGVGKDMLMLALQDPRAEVERPKSITMTSGAQTSLIFLNPREREVQHDDHDPHKQELNSLQGTWSLEITQSMTWPKTPRNGVGKLRPSDGRQWVINGNEITWRTSPRGQEEKLTFTIDPTQSPKHFDVTFVTGPLRGKKCQGIYERGGKSGTMLWLCLVDPSSEAARPSKFGMSSESGHNLVGLMPVKTTPDAAVADERIATVEGTLLELNSPGAITVVISLGTDDGVKSGDLLAILRNGKRIGRLKVAKVERDRSTASITAVEDVKALEVGDRVTNQELPAGPRVPERQPPQNPDGPKKQDKPTGVLSGRFVYNGEPPVAQDLFPGFAEINIDKPQERGPDGRFSGVEAVYREYLKHKIRPTTIDQSLRVGKNRGLADVVLWVVSEDIPWTPSPENQLPVTIQIKNASFVPPATAVIAGQPVIIENQDLVDQIVAAMFSRALSPPFNVLLKARSTESSTKMVFPVPEPFPAKISLPHCPWASGLLFVHNNPYVAISQEDGSFRIPNLPVGQWEFQAWHPRSGYITDWPHLRGPRRKGRFTQIIKAGDNRLAAIELPPELFKVRAGVDKISLLGQWKLIAKATGGEPVDRFNYDGMQWKLGKETLDILPATINRAGAAEKPMPKSSYTIDNTQSPPHFNWTFGEGEMSIEIPAIYELKDDVLRVCVPQHGEPRPTGFETKGQKWTLYEFKRVLGD